MRFVLVLQLRNNDPNSNTVTLGFTEQVRAVCLFIKIYHFLQAAVVDSCLSRGTPRYITVSDLGPLFHPAGLSLLALRTSVPWDQVLTCSSIAADGDVCCFTTLFLLWNWPHGDVHGVLRKQHKWCPEEKLSTDCTPISLAPGTLETLNFRQYIV